MTQENQELENILYELLIYAEWQQEPEFQGKVIGDKEGNENEDLFRKWLGRFVSPLRPPSLVRKLNNLQMPWAFAIGGSGAVIAILQDTSLEIRTSRDEYGAIIGRTQVWKDPYPQWRKMLWSPDCTMLACAHSNGKLDFYDLIGAQMFSIENKTSMPQNDNPDFQYAIAGMAFSDVRIKNTQWSYEFIVANYAGTINGYYISPSDGFKASHTFSLSTFYPFGISCFAYHPTHNILIVCGSSQKLQSANEESSQMGISTWRMLSDYPYYKISSLIDSLASSKNDWKSFLSQYFNPNLNEDLVFKMSFSPNGKLLATVHTSGALYLWDVPSLKRRNNWSLELQPNYADVNPQFCEPGMKKKSDLYSADSFPYHIIDINWWSDESIIMARHSGAVSVSSMKTLQNLLGVSPEWFEPSPSVTPFCDRGFLALEREVRVQGKKRSTDDTDDEDDSGDEEETSFLAYSFELAQRALYFITDSDRFQPPRKKMKMLVKTYRLLCLKSTTPEELYSRKINNEEYGEALALANSYNLDSDLVYQRQWRKMPATVESIHDYLSKIKKRSWVLHECMERVPENFEAAKELLHYGLQGTDLKALIAIGKGEDHGRFILCPPYEDEDADYETSLSFHSEMEDIYEIKRAKRQKKKLELLKQVNFKKLTLEQKQLCQCRLKLLHYLDRLTTYETILGGPLHADQHYDPNFFKLFRTQSGLEAAIYFACNSNWEAVATLFTYHGSETLTHRLAILCNFPETTSPIDYQSLLPLYNEKESAFLPWDEHSIREPDWCELKYKTNPPSEDFAEEFYENYPNLAKYKQLVLDYPLVTDWFCERTKEIESKTGLIENSLQLLKLGMQRRVQGLEKIFDDVMTLEQLVFECGINVNLSLHAYQELNDFEKVKLMMSTTTKETFWKNVTQWLLPFLSQCDRHESGSGKTHFKSYLLSLSKEDLFYCKEVLRNSKAEPVGIVPDFNEFVALILECVYSCERTDELRNASAIQDLLLSLPDLYSRNNRKVVSLPASVATFKKHIIVAELLDKNSLSVPLEMVQKISENATEVKKVLVKLTRMASHKIPVLDENDWTGLLSDILEMQKVLFQCVSIEDCYEIVLHSLLCSGKSENITFAGKMMECNNKLKKERSFIGPQTFKLPFMKSVALVLCASQEYFNSSADASDPCMNLAKNCLNLIEDVPASIEEEKDLISSISLLQEFKVSTLPLQVRLSENRMVIVQEALKKKERNYKKSAKIMKLANLLRAGKGSDREREGKVLTLIGEHAFQAKDYNECLSACNKLMDGCHEEGWLICYTLGGCNDFDNIPARSALMSFALAHCSEDLIETILRSKAELKLQVLQDRVKFLLGDIPLQFNLGGSENKIPNPEEVNINGTNALWQTSERTFQALQSTSQTAKVVLTSVKSVQFWKDAINWIQPPGMGWNGKGGSDDDSNANLTKQGITAFYDGLIENAHINKYEGNYLRYARPDLDQSAEIASSILSASLIQDSLKQETEKSTLESSVILDIAKAFLPENTLYSIFVLLALKETEKAEALFKVLPSSPIVIQVACLYYAIKLHINLGGEGLKDLQEGLNPVEFCKKTLELKQTNPKLEQNADCEKFWALLQKYDRMMHDFVQAEILHSIGGGVDATRFANDDVYKKDTILGTSMTLDDSIFQTAVTLAQHYDVPVWDLYMTHLEYLFLEESVSAIVLNERIDKFGVSDKLMQQKKLFESRLRDYVYPGISGNDHDKLLICLSMLEKLGDNMDQSGVKPSEHIKMLTKFKAAMKNINYKLVMSPEKSSTYLLSILNESNVHVFAKAASNIPKQGDSFYESSNIYSLWLQKYFYEGSSSNSKIPVTKTDWMQRYESCSDMLQRLDSGDILELADSIIFCDKALEKMTLDCRTEIIKRLVKFCRAKSSKHKNNVVLSMEWSEAAKLLNCRFLHLQRLEEQTFLELRESSDPKIQKYCKDFDLSKSIIEKLQVLLARIVLEGPDLELLKTFMSCCPSDIDWEPSDAYMKAIDMALDLMKEGEDSTFHFKEISPVQALESILIDITKNQDELMIEDVAADKLHEFCQDSEVSVSIRLSILQILEKTNCISSEYCELLLLYRTQAVVSAMWPNLQVSEDEVNEEFQRKVLLDSLLSLSHEIAHYTSLAKLLNHWPPFSEVGESDEEPWTKLLCKLISISSKDSLRESLDILDTALSCTTFNEECCSKVFSKIKEQGSILHTLKCALKSSYSALHKEALELLINKPDVTTDDYDNELMELLLKNRLTAQIVSTGLYKPMIEYLMHCQDDAIQESCKSLDSVVRDLYDAGHEFEAGSLLLIKNSTHSGLSTFSSATYILKKWLGATTKS